MRWDDGRDRLLDEVEFSVARAASSVPEFRGIGRATDRLSQRQWLLIALDSKADPRRSGFGVWPRTRPSRAVAAAIYDLRGPTVMVHYPFRLPGLPFPLTRETVVAALADSRGYSSLESALQLTLLAAAIAVSIIAGGLPGHLRWPVVIVLLAALAVGATVVQRFFDPLPQQTVLDRLRIRAAELEGTLLTEPVRAVLQLVDEQVRNRLYDVELLFLPQPMAAAAADRTRALVHPRLGPGTRGALVQLGNRIGYLTAGHVLGVAAQQAECFRKRLIGTRSVSTGQVLQSGEPSRMPDAPSLDYAVVGLAELAATETRLAPVLGPDSPQLGSDRRSTIGNGTSNRPKTAFVTNMELTSFAGWSDLWVLSGRSWAARRGDSGGQVRLPDGRLLGHVVAVGDFPRFGGRSRICYVQDAFTTLLEIEKVAGVPASYRQPT